MKQGHPNASHLYEAERRVEHAARPGFRILELQLSPTQKVPWHSHTDTSDTLYVLEGHMRLFLQPWRSPCDQGGATAFGDQRWREVTHVLDVARYR